MEDFLKQIIVEAGDLAKDYFLKGVTYKTKAHLGDLVTVADIVVSDLLIKKIHERYPDHAIHSEEEKQKINAGAQFEWIIDPIDGTRNFANGIGVWCVLIALYENDVPRAAAIYAPMAGELFFAQAGKGASLNGLPIHANSVDTLDYGLGVAVRGVMTAELKRENYNRFLCRLVNDTTVWIMNHGTMLTASNVASGGMDFFVSNAGYDWDFAAPALICAEAGALVTDADGQIWTRQRRDIVMANPKLHPKILELLK